MHKYTSYFTLCFHTMSFWGTLYCTVTFAGILILSSRSRELQCKIFFLMSIVRLFSQCQCIIGRILQEEKNKYKLNRRAMYFGCMLYIGLRLFPPDFSQSVCEQNTSACYGQTFAVYI